MNSTIRPSSAPASDEFDFVSYCQNWSLFCESQHPTNISLLMECFLDACMTPRTQSLSIALPITIIYGLIFVSGVLGNVCVCLVTRAGVSWLNSVTSAYLVNLACTNLLNVLAGLPFDIHLMWHQYPWNFGPFLCHFKGWISETTTYVSVLTIVAFTFERYTAICKVFSLRATLKRRVTWTILMTWIIGGSCAIPYGLNHQLYVLLNEDRWPLGSKYGPIVQTKMCMLPIAFDDDLKQSFRLIMHTTMIVFFIIPLLFILICYTLIGLAIQRSGNEIRRNRPSNQKAASEKKPLIILAAVVIAFFICYAPYQAQRMLFFYIRDINDQIYRMVNHYLYIISGVSFYLGSTVNPLLYNVISARFRKAFKALLLCQFKLSPLSHHLSLSANGSMRSRSKQSIYHRNSSRNLQKRLSQKSKTSRMSSADIISIQSKGAASATPSLTECRRPPNSDIRM